MVVEGSICIKCQQGEIIELNNHLVCNGCGDLITESNLVVEQTNFNVVSNDFKDTRGQNTSIRTNIYNKNSNLPSNNSKFENKLEIICGLLGIGENTKGHMKNHFKLAAAKWPLIRRVNPDYEYIVAALAHISIRKEGKYLSLIDIGIKLKLKYYTIGVISMKIKQAAGIIVEILPELDCLNKGIDILKNTFKLYSPTEYDQIKSLALELIKFCKSRGMSDGRTPASIYIACLYVAQCNKLTRIEDYNILADTATFDNSQNTSIIKTTVGDAKKKRKYTTKNTLLQPMKPFLQTIYDEMNIQKNAVIGRIKEIESHFLAYASQTGGLFSVINAKNLHQYSPLLLNDYFLRNDFDQYGFMIQTPTSTTTPTTTTTTQEVEVEEQKEFMGLSIEGIEAELEKEFSSLPVGAHESWDKNRNNGSIVDDESPDERPKKKRNVNRSTKKQQEQPKQQEHKDLLEFIIDNSEDDDLESLPSSSSSSSKSTISSSFDLSDEVKEAGKTKKSFIISVLSRSTNAGLPPAFINSIYRNVIRRLRIVNAKYRLAEKGQYDSSRITNKDKMFFQQYKCYYPKPSKSADDQIEKLLLSTDNENIIIEGATTADDIQLDAFLKDNNQYFQCEELGEKDIPDSELELYIKNDTEKQFHKELYQDYENVQFDN